MMTVLPFDHRVKQSYMFDVNSRRIKLSDIRCPICGHKHCYPWGRAQKNEFHPNAGCPECGYKWNVTTMKPISQTQ